MTGISGRTFLTSRNRLRPSMPGMLMSDRMTIGCGCRRPASAAPPRRGHEVQRVEPCVTSRRKCWRNSSATSGSSSTLRMLTVISPPRRCSVPAPRQVHDELGELPDFAVHGDRAAVLCRDDVVADRETKAGALAGRLGREERLEQFLAVLRRDAGAVVPHPHLDGIAEGARRHLEHRAEAVAGLAAALIGGIEAVANQVQE